MAEAEARVAAEVSPIIADDGFIAEVLPAEDKGGVAPVVSADDLFVSEVLPAFADESLAWLHSDDGVRDSYAPDTLPVDQMIQRGQVPHPDDLFA